MRLSLVGPLPDSLKPVRPILVEDESACAYAVDFVRRERVAALTPGLGCDIVDILSDIEGGTHEDKGTENGHGVDSDTVPEAARIWARMNASSARVRAG